MSPERGRRNPDWGSIFRRAKFRLCPNGTNFMSFQHYSAPWVWWHAQFLHLIFWFSSHFWKWVMPVSDLHMWAVIFHFLNATRLMVFSDYAAELLSLQQMAAWGIWCVFHVLLHLFLVEMHYVLQIPVDTWVEGSCFVFLLMYFQLWIYVMYESLSCHIGRMLFFISVLLRSLVFQDWRDTLICYMSAMVILIGVFLYVWEFCSGISLKEASHSCVRAIFPCMS